MSICKGRKVYPLGADARPCLVILNQQLDANLADDNLTCKKALDGELVQIDFVLSDCRMFVDNVWNDDMVAVGVDHRCVHCVLKFPGRHVRREARNKSLKSWVPFLDAAGKPSLYRNVLDTQLALVDNPSCREIENALLVAGNLGGKPSRRRIKFKPSRHLQSLRQQRRQTQLHEERKKIYLSNSKTASVGGPEMENTGLFKFITFHHQLGSIEAGVTARTCTYERRGCCCG